MAGRPNVSTGILPSTYGLGAHKAQSRQSNLVDRPMAAKADVRRRVAILLAKYSYFGSFLLMTRTCRRDAACYPHPSQRSSGGNSYQGGYGNGSVGVVLPERARAVRSAGYGQGTLDRSQAQYRPNAPFHTGTPANLQRPQFDNWSSKKPSLLGEFGTGSKIVYWGDLKERDDKMRAMRMKYDLNDSRRALIREV